MAYSLEDEIYLALLWRVEGRRGRREIRATGRAPTWRRCHIWPAASSWPTRTSVTSRQVRHRCQHGPARQGAGALRSGRPVPQLDGAGRPRTRGAENVMSRDGYLGYRPADHQTPFAEFFRPEMAPLPRHVVEALEHGPQAEPALPVFDDVAALLDDGYQQTENGYGALRDGGLQVSVRTDMPDVSPAMWAWWFGWHGSDSRRYKLWHPRAHVSARWSDSGGDGNYVGRTSVVQEYLGSAFTRAAIQFVEPSQLGLGASGDSVAICARVGIGRHSRGRRVVGTPRATDARWFGDAVAVLDGRRACGGATREQVDRRGGAADRGATTARCTRSHGALRTGDEPPRRISAGAFRPILRTLTLSVC